MGRYLLRLLAHLTGDHRRSRAAHRRRAAAVGAESEGRVVRVALSHLDVLRGDAEFSGHDLGEGRLVALPLRLDPELEDGLARGVDSELRGVEHLDTRYVALLAGAGAHDLRERGEPYAHDPALFTSLLLLFQKLLITGDPQSLL